MNKTTELEVDGHKYQVEKLNALKQLHVARRLGPMLVVAGVTVDMVRDGMKLDLDDVVALVGPVMEILSRMPDDEVEYIIFACLGAAKRLQGDAWAPLMTSDGKQLMFADMDMPAMVRVVLEVIKENLGPFLKGLAGGQS